MTAERWQQVDAVLDRVLDAPPSERAAVLDAACGDDAALRSEVEALLEAEANAPAFLEGTAATWAETWMDAPTEPHALPVFPMPCADGYRVVQELGHGGMSTVYLAERVADGRRVALKVLRHRLGTSRQAGRFRMEREVLAGLNHPNIARLLDGGVTAGGRPYLVMEHVDGAPITDYAQRHRLPLRSRLRLVETVCHAVQHAHRKLIVHRDLKPGNILVTATGQVKLLDFGIAKLLDDRAVALTVPETRTGERWMTPGYAAPEQIRGGEITTATDVYQLGLLAYELLTGVRPFADEPDAAAQRTAVLTRMPEPPSKARRADRAGRTGRKRAVGGGPPEAWRDDLDTVVLKALRTEPERRYVGADAFADDLRRYRTGQPVEARAPTWHYRAQVFMRRNRRAVFTAVAIALLLVGYAVTMTVQTSRIAAERNRAQTAAAQAEQVATFMADLLEMADPEEGEGRTVTAERMLARGADRVNDELAGQPAVQARLMNVIGSSYRSMGHYTDALALHEQALAFNTEHYGPQSLEVADTENNIGEVLYYLGRYPEATTHYERSLAVREARHDTPHPDLAQSHNNLGLVDLMQGRYEAAEQHMQAARSVFEETLGRVHWRTANATKNWARVLRRQGRHDAARPLYQEALAIQDELDGADRNMLVYAVTLNDYGLVLRHGGQWAEAEGAHRQALATLRDITSPSHPFVGDALLGLAQVLEAQGRTAVADTTYQAALDQQRRALPGDDVRLADPLLGRGQFLMRQQRATEAEPLLREALRLRRATFPPEHPEVTAAEAALRQVRRVQE
jgi:serine/threonine-protein kinase